ncbi:MAG: hypothetical protein ACI85F_000622 [Bacteroidia bacterium]|jgi:hypothetical protein
MSKVAIIFSIAFCISLSAFADEYPSLFKRMSIEPIKVQEATFQAINETTLNIEPDKGLYDPFDFVNMDIRKSKFRVCCIGAGYGIKYRF